MQVYLNPKSIDAYREFISVKSLPAYSVHGRIATFPDEYSSLIGKAPESPIDIDVDVSPHLYDYQRDIAKIAIRKQKYCVFAECGRGKSLIIFQFAQHAFEAMNRKKRVLIITPPLVVGQMIEEAAKFFPDLPIERVKAAGLQEWLDGSGESVGITNYEALKKTTTAGNLGALILDESSMLKSAYGNYAGICIKLGKGIKWKLSCTGTPAPNDRIEYANQAVFMDQYPTVNAFLATFFVNRGQTDNRWELKPHALRPFYRSLSNWSIFLSDPSVYGWKDNTAPLPPIHTHIHHVPLTDEQRLWVMSTRGELFASKPGGITKRGEMSQIAKGFYKGKSIESNKPGFVCDLIKSWSEEESTLIWCLYDQEQDGLASVIPQSESMSGKTPMAARQTMIDRFKARESHTLISKPKILGFGLNLQVATRQVFSGLVDSFEQYQQAVKRSNRTGSTKPLNVHIPVTELEEPMVENVLQKAHRVYEDTKEQEALFAECGVICK